MKERAETPGSEEGDFVDLLLYVADRTTRSLTAYANIKKICEAYSPGKYRITVIDLLKSPDIAWSEDITAVPTLIRVPRTWEDGRSSGCSRLQKKSLKKST